MPHTLGRDYSKKFLFIGKIASSNADTGKQLLVENTLDDLGRVLAIFRVLSNTNPAFEKPIEHKATRILVEAIDSYNELP